MKWLGAIALVLTIASCSDIPDQPAGGSVPLANESAAAAVANGSAAMEEADSPPRRLKRSRSDRQSAEGDEVDSLSQSSNAVRRRYSLRSLPLSLDNLLDRREFDSAAGLIQSHPEDLELTDMKRSRILISAIDAGHEGLLLALLDTDNAGSLVGDRGEYFARKATAQGQLNILRHLIDTSRVNHVEITTDMLICRSPLANECLEFLRGIAPIPVLVSAIFELLVNSRRGSFVPLLQVLRTRNWRAAQLDSQTVQLLTRLFDRHCPQQMM